MPEEVWTRIEDVSILKIQTPFETKLRVWS